MKIKRFLKKLLNNIFSLLIVVSDDLSQISGQSN